MCFFATFLQISQFFFYRKYRKELDSNIQYHGQLDIKDPIFHHKCITMQDKTFCGWYTKPFEVPWNTIRIVLFWIDFE